MLQWKIKTENYTGKLHRRNHVVASIPLSRDIEELGHLKIFNNTLKHSNKTDPLSGYCK